MRPVAGPSRTSWLRPGGTAGRGSRRRLGSLRAGRADPDRPWCGRGSCGGQQPLHSGGDGRDCAGATGAWRSGGSWHRWRAQSGEAARWYGLAAAQGEPSAQLKLAELYLQGDGVPRDPARAAELLRPAAEAGLAPAQKALADLYASGTGLRADLAQALRLLPGGGGSGRPWQRWHWPSGTRTAMAHRTTPAGPRASTGEPQPRASPPPSARWAISAPRRGVERSPIEAARWYRLAADQGEPWAQYKLGMLYLGGADPDPARALEHLRRAAAAGLAPAQKALGDAYAKGTGVEPDAGSLTLVRAGGRAGEPWALFLWRSAL